MKAIQVNPKARQQWHADFVGGNTAQNRFEGRMLLRDKGAIRFTYAQQYAINLDQLVLRVTGFAS